MWVAVAAGMVTVVTAAMKVQEAGVCKGYNIQVQGLKKETLFTSEDHIAQLLRSAVNGDVKGQKKSGFNLLRIEDLLEQSAWVYNAELYFDNQDILHVNVTERKPLARIYTAKGESFYIDEAGKHIPLSDKISLDLPVFTGYPSKKIMDKPDSTLLQNIIATASFISGDPFWTAQVAQINIKNCGADCWNMEMIPVIGNHKVELGDGSDIAFKFHRLYLFYDQVLKRTGFDKYQKIDVQYNGQVVGIKENYTKVDSLQLRKNIEGLLQQSRDYNEMVQEAPDVNYATVLAKDSLADKIAIEEIDTEYDNNAPSQKEEKAEEVPPVKNTKPHIVLTKTTSPQSSAVTMKKPVRTTNKIDTKAFNTKSKKPDVAKKIDKKPTTTKSKTKEKLIPPTTKTIDKKVPLIKQKHSK